MAEEKKEGATAGEKLEAKKKQWFEVVRNRIVKLPIIRWAKIGRREPPESPHPLYLELEKGWLDMNDAFYKNRLMLVEQRWPAQSNQLGFEDINVEGGKVSFAYPDGIVKLYYDMGVYSDYSRISIEHEWFEHGTGLAEHEIAPLTIPEDEKEWKKNGWEVERVREALAKNSDRPWENFKVKELELLPGTVFHEDNPELDETLYVFSKTGVEKLQEHIDNHNTQIHLRGMQQTQIPVEIRTKLTNLTKTIIEKLLGNIKKIESENLTLLQQLNGKTKIYDTKLQKELLQNLSPESVPTWTVRFSHTYKVIKQAVMKEVEEKIRGKKPKKRMVFKYFNFRDVYDEEKRQLEESIRRERDERNRRSMEQDAMIASLGRLINNRNLFRNEVESLINTNRGTIISILDDGAKGTEEKFNEITGILSHRDALINNLLKDILVLSKIIIYKIINSADNSGTKLSNIQNMIVNLKRSARIEVHITNNSSAIKGALNPVGRAEDTDTTRNKDMDEMYHDLMYGFKVGYPEVDDFIESIFTANRNAIEFTINKIIDKNNKKINIDFDNYFNTVTNWVINVSRQDDNEIGWLQLHVEKFEREKERILAEKGKLEEDEARKREIEELETNGNKNSILNELRRVPDNFYQRPKEVELGLDEYGHPLEIGKDGTVLIDKWWAELARNHWQIRTIAMKTGGDEVLRNHLGVRVTYYQGKPRRDALGLGGFDEDELDEPADKKKKEEWQKTWRPLITGNPTRPIRKVNDPDLIGYIDLLDMSTLIFGIWDSLRDDIRDGRYHRHSKSVGDYVIESMGGYDKKRMAPYFEAAGVKVPFTEIKIKYSAIRRYGVYVGRGGVDPTSAFHLHDVDYINATPFDFENTKSHPDRVPEDEDAVTRSYKMRLPDGVTKQDENDPAKPPYNFISGKRKPTKYDPAFDRRAKGMDFVFWGNMYYWRWAGYINEWSENPYPHISTRGIALYLKHLAESDVYYFQEAQRILEGHRYDYGTRGQGMFPWNNPSSGKEVVGPSAEN